MGFRNGAYAKVWDVREGNGRFTTVRLSISHKSRSEEGQYEQDFSGFCTFIGNAHAAASRLQAGDRIKLGEVDVNNHYDKERNREYTNFNVFSFDFADNKNNADTQGRTAAQAPSRENTEDPTPDDDDLPF